MVNSVMSAIDDIGTVGRWWGLRNREAEFVSAVMHDSDAVAGRNVGR